MSIGPSNVDDANILSGILEALSKIAQVMPVIFPIHPRTKKKVMQFGLDHYFNPGDQVKGIWLTDPLGYLEFLHLNMNAHMVLTDSGGLQEETTVLRVPCITLRNNTERPITCVEGTNQIAGNKKEDILEAANRVLSCDLQSSSIPYKNHVLRAWVGSRLWPKEPAHSFLKDIFVTT